jgi:hypothetical protein
MKFTLTITAVVLASIIAYGWGAPDLLPEDQREKIYKFPTTLDKKKAFTKLAIWTAKTFSNSNEAIKLKDAELGTIVAKGILSCEALKIGNGYAKNQHLDFTLEITVEDKNAEVKVSNVVGTSDAGYDNGARPSKKEEMDAAAKECLDPYVAKIKKELN